MSIILYLFFNNPVFILNTVLKRPLKNLIPIPAATPLLCWFAVWNYRWSALWITSLAISSRHILQRLLGQFSCVSYCGVCVAIMRLLYAYTAVVVQFFLRLYYSLPDIDLAYLLAPLLYIKLILFMHVISHVPVNTCWTRYIWHRVTLFKTSI